MAPLHSQGCEGAALHSQGYEGAACPCLDTKLQPPEKTITNWFLFLSPPCTGYHPRYYPLGFRAGALNSHLCLGRKALVSSAQKRPGGPGGEASKARIQAGGGQGGRAGAGGFRESTRTGEQKKRALPPGSPTGGAWVPRICRQ